MIDPLISSGIQSGFTCAWLSHKVLLVWLFLWLACLNQEPHTMLGMGSLSLLIHRYSFFLVIYLCKKLCHLSYRSFLYSDFWWFYWLPPYNVNLSSSRSLFSVTVVVKSRDNQIVCNLLARIFYWQCCVLPVYIAWGTYCLLVSLFCNIKIDQCFQMLSAWSIQNHINQEPGKNSRQSNIHPFLPSFWVVLRSSISTSF